MRRTAQVLAPAVLVIVAGCAMLAPGGPPGSAASGPAPMNSTLERALGALELGHYRAAWTDLSSIYSEAGDAPEGRQALVALIAAEMDPRNPVRRLDVGANLALSGLQRPEPADWADPLLETFYLLALELGAQPPEAANAADTSTGRLLPHLPLAPVPARIQEAEAERLTLEERVSELEQQVAELGEELERKTRELERIRRTLRP